MIDMTAVRNGDILKIVENGIPGFAEIGDLVKVIDVSPVYRRVKELYVPSVIVENQDGENLKFIGDSGAARFEFTEKRGC